ncbi:MAG: hypothetical protein HC849_27450 [Oscillatoriales cyanobacterium RU_3_3]|nr:hypothetical protein [Oscillatoriales cyanobacterium RU_3_3]
MSSIISKIVDFGGDDFPVAAQDGQPSHLNQPGFHPTPIYKQYGMGIPAELAKFSQHTLSLEGEARSYMISAEVRSNSIFLQKFPSNIKNYERSPSIADIRTEPC